MRPSPAQRYWLSLSAVVLVTILLAGTASGIIEAASHCSCRRVRRLCLCLLIVSSWESWEWGHGSRRPSLARCIPPIDAPVPKRHPENPTEISQCK